MLGFTRLPCSRTWFVEPVQLVRLPYDARPRPTRPSPLYLPAGGVPLPTDMPHRRCCAAWQFMAHLVRLPPPPHLHPTCTTCARHTLRAFNTIATDHQYALLTATRSLATIPSYVLTFYARIRTLLPFPVPAGPGSFLAHGRAHRHTVALRALRFLLEKRAASTGYTDRSVTAPGFTRDSSFTCCVH